MLHYQLLFFLLLKDIVSPEIQGSIFNGIIAHVSVLHLTCLTSCTGRKVNFKIKTQRKPIYRDRNLKFFTEPTRPLTAVYNGILISETLDLLNLPITQTKS